MKNVLFKPKIKILKRRQFPPLLSRRKLKEENDTTGLPVRRIFYKDSLSPFLKKRGNTVLKTGIDS